MTPTLPPSRLRAAGFCALVFALAFAAYWPALRGSMIWDDGAYLTRPELQSGHGLWRIWTEMGATEQYYPLLHGAFWAEHRLWGDATVAYHLLNVALHAASACLFALILIRLGVPGAWLAGLIFALHPVCAESVAWITEQKNTLSTLLYLLSLLTYLRFDRTRSKPWYALALGLFGLALLAKTVTATLPAALLVIFWWRRGRLEWRRDARPLVPWLALGAAAGLFSGWVERTYVGARGAAYALNGIERILVAGRASWFYLGKLLWPANLEFMYPRWRMRAGDPGQWAAPVLLVIALGALAAWTFRRREAAWARGILAAVLFFLGSLFPTIGFLNVYAFLFSYVADHWQYL
ncbi:MAG TPA: glycosyltransferase family 39 protein, partial [Opitutaceae bacterium]|nr:glycosyltransferase family 39 protein [Opitutaceae bacterium]